MNMFNCHYIGENIIPRSYPIHVIQSVWITIQGGVDNRTTIQHGMLSSAIEKGGELSIFRRSPGLAPGQDARELFHSTESCLHLKTTTSSTARILLCPDRSERGVVEPVSAPPSSCSHPQRVARSCPNPLRVRRH
jgi:hypothetical protein